MGQLISRICSTVIFWRNRSRDILQNRCDVCREPLVLSSPITICPFCYNEFAYPQEEIHEEYCPPLFPNVFND